jgi:hypothetical protein
LVTLTGANNVVAKVDFSEAEWKSVIGALPMTGLAIASSSPNGPFGVMKEMMSIGMAMAEVLKTGSSNSLINAIIEDMKARATKPEAPAGITSHEQAMNAALAHLKAVGALVDAKCGASEALEFKRWLVALAQRVAEACNEGGFFGIGGVRVSEAEKAAIGKVASSLGVSA